MNARTLFVFAVVISGSFLATASEAQYSCRWNAPGYLPGDGLPHSYVGDIDGDSQSEIVIVPTGATTHIQILDAITGAEEWDVDLFGDIVYVSLLDLDDDPEMEIFIQTQADCYVCESSGPVAAPGQGPVIAPDSASLNRAYPNPFNPVTTIPFTIGTAGQVELEIYNVAGRLVRRLVEEDLDPGEHEIPWDGRDDAGALLPSGEYFYRLAVAGTAVGTQKAVILK